MKKKALFWVKIGLLAVVIVAVTAGGWKLLDYQKGANDYQEAASLAFAGIELDSLKAPPAASTPPSQETSATESLASPEASSSSSDNVSSPDISSEPQDEEPPAGTEDLQETDAYAQALAQLDLNALRQVNPEVVGWISIPDTDIFYPIMQTDNNQHYLNYTWKNEGSSVGAIFLEQTSKPDLSGFNTIVYGHQMMDGSMFGSLHEYSDYDYWMTHPSIYIVVDRGVYRYDIFSAFEVSVRDLIYRLDLEENQMQQELIDFCLSRSVLTEDHNAPEIDLAGNLLTLSTCTGWGYSTRWVVVAECALRPDGA